MAYTVEIREVATGETVTTQQNLDGVHPSGRDSLFWWTDGNFGCDCNRSMEFWRGKGVTEDEVRQRTEGVKCSCGTGIIAYLVRITLPDGTVVLDEFGDDAPTDASSRALVVRALVGPLSETEVTRLAAAVEEIKAAYGKVPFDVKE